MKNARQHTMVCCEYDALQASCNSGVDEPLEKKEKVVRSRSNSLNISPLVESGAYLCISCISLCHVIFCVNCGVFSECKLTAIHSATLGY